MERWRRPHHRGADAAAGFPVAVNSYHPSFSSSLLDAIDRSIDKGGAFGGRREGRATDGAPTSAGAARGRLHCTWQDAAEAKQRDAYGRGADDRCFRGRAGEYDQPQQHYSRAAPQQHRRGERFVGNSTSSSSESSYGGFSSSEAESVVLSGRPLPRPVRTSCGPPARKPEQVTPLDESKQKANKGSIRSRFRASKLYGELKKGRSAPVSPGARLASFLNTLFSTAGHPKKAKISTAAANPAGRGGDDSACSSASSYSRSCLSKTPSSRGKAASSGGSSAKRSVRFYPVSVIVDEDCRPCGQKSLYEGERPGRLWQGSLPALEHPLPCIRVFRDEPPLASTRVREDTALPSYLAEAEERKRAREAARGLISAYKEKKRGLDGFDMDEDVDEEEEEEDDDVDDDAASYSSSDLFELKSLAAAGCGGGVRYRDELPVYETTRLDANRAIARGLLV